MNSFLNGKLDGRPARSEKLEALRVSVIDPSMFTAAYDEALVSALLRTGAETELVGRPMRQEENLPTVPYREVFYRNCDLAPRRFGRVGAAVKAIEHARDHLLFAVSRRRPRIAHYQWIVFPLIDTFALQLARRHGPVVVTVHDTTPFNGTPTHRLQASGFLAALRSADRLIVHTAAGKLRLVERGICEERIAVVPHGPLGSDGPSRIDQADRRWTIVAFGKMRPYKGLEVLIEAVARLDRETRGMLRLIVAGEPMMDLAPLHRCIREHDLTGTVDVVDRRLDRSEMDTLFAGADSFVFPYREIEASGVFYLVQGLGRWVIASRLGAFVEALEDGRSGRLVAPGDVRDLAAALDEACTERRIPTAAPRVTGWDAIARETLAVYAAAHCDWEARPASARGEAMLAR